MIDMSPESPPAQVQVIQQRLVECGLKTGAFTVRYEDELQSIEIVIGPQAGASTEKFGCIREAAQYEIVTFSENDLQRAYAGHISDLLRPKMLKDARESLEKRGLLTGFPERSRFASDRFFAEALEKHCGVKAGSFFIEGERGLIVQPKTTPLNDTEGDQMTCLINALMYVSAKGENFAVGFIGNEQFGATEHE
jgi:hypothetical protein